MTMMRLVVCRRAIDDDVEYYAEHNRWLVVI